MTPRLLFANLGADVARCVKAEERGDMTQYHDSLMRGYKTASLLRAFGAHTAYEEALLLLRACEHARTDGRRGVFSVHLNALIASYAVL